ncbi:LytTR family DNA-binding domain-containing protein [Emticicia sp. BO119]|uniref:LytR/AlgR family response regulator transcription factor n=1 Tax=Emticicia sp. BO119 TaxID=2757768 RepID=UPI0015F0B9D6|nr:LytTR family DNA-binding domain-containing protein [Emticicia sp. BO119]MBA4851736.1 LytTR family transcriptional regulator [Emticicia sp. BO119]
MNNETLVHVGGRMKFAPSKIILLESDINYTRLYLSDGSMFLTSTNIGQLERRFAAYPFFRINRTYLINLQFIENQQDTNLRMCNQMEMNISRRRTTHFYRFLRKTLPKTLNK